MPHSFHFFGSTLIGVYLAFHLYFLWWTDRYFSPSPRSSRAFKFWLLAMALLFPAAEYFEGRAAGGLSDAFIWLGFFWLGAMFILVTVLLLCDLLFLAVRFFRPGWRRALGASALILAAALIALAVFRGAALPEVRPVAITLRGLPAALDGFKIVQISDVHIGRIISVGKFRRMAALVNAARPDLIVFTGDITESGVEDPEGVCSVIRSMNASYGKAGVLGNHDSFAGPDNSAAFFEACGVKMLRFGKYEPVPGLQVAGVDSPRRGAPAARTPALLVSELSPSKPLLFLSHRPEMFEQVLKGFPALALSGHTHEGQLYPFGLLERHLFKYFYGLYREGGSSVYVTSGAGTWGPPMRLFTVSELPLFVLHPA
ncbi:MAG: metallophosphoesterase [Elusimicrobia bacterium]|nr:metallophosphoesterase [Elusimicrobiota bacterium]